jgi:hypothetical protein
VRGAVFDLRSGCCRILSARRETGSVAGTWRSLVAHLTGGQGVAGSNPVVPTAKRVFAAQKLRRPSFVILPSYGGPSTSLVDPLTPRIPGLETRKPGCVTSDGRGNRHAIEQPLTPLLALGTESWVVGPLGWWDRNRCSCGSGPVDSPLLWQEPCPRMLDKVVVPGGLLPRDVGLRRWPTSRSAVAPVGPRRARDTGFRSVNGTGLRSSRRRWPSRSTDRPVSPPRPRPSVCAVTRFVPRNWPTRPRTSLRPSDSMPRDGW